MDAALARTRAADKEFVSASEAAGGVGGEVSEMSEAQKIYDKAEGLSQEYQDLTTGMTAAEIMRAEPATRREILRIRNKFEGLKRDYLEVAKIPLGFTLTGRSPQKRAGGGGGASTDATTMTGATPAELLSLFDEQI